MEISVRPAEVSDFEKIVDYFLLADERFIFNMGAEKKKMPKRGEWLDLLHNEFNKNLESKNFFYLIWQIGDIPVGHSNIAKIIFGKEAFMHMHIWIPNKRQKGCGTEFVRLSLPHYFDMFKLKNLYSEPNAYNQAPNHTLSKVGFTFERKYETVPGWINFHQPVNRWSMSIEKYKHQCTSIKL